MRRGEAATCSGANLSVFPSQIDIDPTSSELHKVLCEVSLRNVPPEKDIVAIHSCHVDGDHRWKMSGPLRITEVVVVACADDMHAVPVGRVDPWFEVLDGLIVSSGAEAAIQDVIAEVNSQAGGFPDNVEFAGQVVI